MDLPAPEAPIIETTSPFSAEKSIPLRTCREPKLFFMPFAWMIILKRIWVKDTDYLRKGVCLNFPKKNLPLQSLGEKPLREPGCGAVGSASGLGPEGRKFESCHPDVYTIL